jgi:hypothetical protein
MLRAVGLGQWVGPTVAQVEAGTRRVSIDEVFALSLLLRAPLVELLSPISKHVRIAPDLLPLGSAFLRAESEEQIDRWRLWLDTALETTFSTRFMAFRAEAEEQALAEEAAARFGTTTADVKKTALRIWYRSFREERERRLAGGGSPATLRTRRGHITRDLMAELETVFTRRRKRAQVKRRSAR